LEPENRNRDFLGQEGEVVGGQLAEQGGVADVVESARGDGAHVFETVRES
jgi:hypothetical protein